MGLSWGVAVAQPVVINEIHFDPADNTVPEEFIELYNPGDLPADLSGWFFSEGISYTFSPGAEIGARAYLVVAEDPATMRRLYGDLPLAGPLSGQLSNEGETIALRDAEGNLVDTVDYKVGFPWPTASAGDGSSMELMHPSLDNDLGGSWRASGVAGSGPPTRRYLVSAEESGWRYRKGTSNPPSTWRRGDFVEGGGWLTGQAGIGYGDGDDNTVLSDMRNNYSSIYLRKSFEIAAESDVPDRLVLGVHVDDGAIVWINDQEVGRFHVSPGDKNYNDLAENHEVSWEETTVRNPAALLHAGTNVLAMHVLNTTLGSSDLSADATLYVPAAGEGVSGQPTPGAENSVFSPSAPPQIRQVRHGKDSPVEGEANVVTAKITDPDGVEAVELEYQVVLPGRYIPAFLPVPHGSLLADADQPRPANPAFEDAANWTSIRLLDDGTGGDEVPGDGIYAGVIPPQANRTLVRYRILARDALGAEVRVPYADDPTLNFAYFVYNGVPDYDAATSIQGHATTYAAEALTSMPVYILITRNEDLAECIAASSSQQIPQGNQARFAENWEGAFVHDGVVYDHINYRLRGANGRYQVPPGNPGGVAGKRHWRFKFNKGHHLQTWDRFGKPYPTRWRVLNTGRMFGNRLDGNWGLGDQVNDILWRAYGVPAPFGHAFHWRVIDGAEEAPSGPGGQYSGDFWGIERAFENYDVRFLEAHDLPKGNLYKLVNQTKDAKEQQRYQSPYAVADGSDHDNIEANLRASRPDAWLLAYVNYEKWYRYHAIAQAIRHYDYWPDANKNATWYFEPQYTADNGYLGVMWTLPFDADATWGPTWNQGMDRPYDAIYGGGGKPEFQKAYRNHIREVRDLLWQRDELEQVVRQTAATMAPLQNADIDRWRNAPAAEGRQYFSASSQRSLEGKAQDMLRFAFTGGSWPGGSVGAGGRAAFLDQLADGPDAGKLPARPTATYTGDPAHPADGLTFRTSAFSDPQGSGSFGAMKWRMAEVSDIPSPGSLPLSDPAWTAEPVKLELQAAWESTELRTFDPSVTIPLSAVIPGRRYRVRVRMMDDTARWSHWSLPVEFTAGPPAGPVPALTSLRITEIMYHPVGGADFEFIELQNAGPDTLDLRDVRFRDGIEFEFAGSRIASLGPGEIVVLVRNLEAFSLRYDTSSMRVAEYSGRLENAGERLTLTYGAQLDILDFTYLDTWYPETDGLGLSLNILSTGLPPEAWGSPESWFPASVLDGTPGAVDPGASIAGLVRPGDANGDGTVDISDGLSLLLLLFGGEAGDLPCGGDSVADGGNPPLLDFNGDGAVDVSDAVSLLAHLFQGGPPHILGGRCTPLEGCPSACFGW